MVPFALLDSQSVFISGVALILGTVMLRMYWDMRKSLRKPKSCEYSRQLSATRASAFGLQTSENGAKNHGQAVHQSECPVARNMPEEEPGTSRQRAYEQFDVELLTLSRQIKAEIDIKIVALQLMIADADRVLQRLEGHLPHSRQITIEDTPRPTIPTPLSIPLSPSHPMSHSPHDPGDLKNLVVEDPFAEGDFGFDKAMRDLDQLSSSIPAFDAMRSLDSWDTSKSDSPASFPEWDRPLSYSVSGYRTVTDAPVPQVHDTPEHHAASKTSRRKNTYTNKLLTQAPPQLDTLMTGEPVGRMGSKPRHVAGQSPPAHDEPLVPPVIPKMPPPNAKALVVESLPFAQAETGFDKISVRRGRRHQLQYLIEKGMSPKEIAAHLEMPVGEVELIFSLHKRLSGETAKTAPQPLADKEPASFPRIIAAENVVMPEKVIGKTATPPRRFRVIKSDDGEQVTG